MHEAVRVTYSEHAPGLPHARDTVGKMAQLARDAAHTYPIRQLATRITHGVPSKQPLAELRALYKWTRDNVRYRNDPHGLEWLQTPWRTLQERAGDCDDIACLLAALAQALGRPVRFQIVGQSPGRYSHVYVQAQLPEGQWVTLDPVLEPPAASTRPRPDDPGRFGWQAVGHVRTFNAGGTMLGAPTTARDRLLWQTVPYFPQLPPTGGYADPRNAGAVLAPDYRYRSAHVAGRTIYYPTRSGVLGAFSPADVLPPGAGADAAREIAEAAALIGGASVVPIFGTAAGAIAAGIKLLGPRIFAGITGLFAGRTNPWPDKFARVMRSAGSPAEKVAALEALRMLAAAKRGSRNRDTARWARGGVARAAKHMEELAALYPEARAAMLARVRAAAPVQVHALGPAQLEQLIASINARFREPPPLTAQGAAHLRAQLAQATAQLQRARMRPPPAPRPPAPPARPTATTPAMWSAWLRAARAAQLARAPVPPPPLIPPMTPPGMPPDWAAWLDHARAAQRAGRLPAFPPPVRPEWTLGQVQLLTVPAAASLAPIVAALGAAPIRPSITFSLGQPAAGTVAAHRHRLVLPSGEVVYTDKDALAGWYERTQSAVLGAVPGDYPGAVLAARAAVDAVAAHIRSRADKRPPGKSLPAVLAFQQVDGQLKRDGLWGSNTQTAAAWYLATTPAQLPPTLPALRPPITWTPPPAPPAVAPPPMLAPAPPVRVAPPAPPRPPPVVLPPVVIPVPAPSPLVSLPAERPPYVPYVVTPAERPPAPRVLETLPRELPPLPAPAPTLRVIPGGLAPPAPPPIIPPPGPLLIAPAPVPPIPLAPPAPADTHPFIPVPIPGLPFGPPVVVPAAVAPPAPRDGAIWWLLGLWLLSRRRKGAA